MKAMFEDLKLLQDVYSQKLKLEKEIEEVYTRIESNQEVLSRLKEKQIVLKEKLENIITEEKGLKAQAAEVESNREKTEFRIAEIKTQREYEALEKEIKAFSIQESTLRKELEIVRSSKDELEGEKTHLQALIEAQEEEIEAEKGNIESEIKEKESRFSFLEKEEDSLSQNLNEELKFKFKRIVRKKEKSIVPMRDSVCTGCNIQLPIEFANIVRKEDEICFCPSCSRILYFEDVETDQEVLEIAGGLSDLISDFE